MRYIRAQVWACKRIHPPSSYVQCSERNFPLLAFSPPSPPRPLQAYIALTRDPYANARREKEEYRALEREGGGGIPPKTGSALPSFSFRVGRTCCVAHLCSTRRRRRREDQEISDASTSARRLPGRSSARSHIPRQKLCPPAPQHLLLFFFLLLSPLLSTRAKKEVALPFVFLWLYGKKLHRPLFSQSVGTMAERKGGWMDENPSRDAKLSILRRKNYLSFPPSLISGAPPRDCDGEGIYFYFLNASRNASSSNFLPNVKNNGAYKVFPPGKKVPPRMQSGGRGKQCSGFFFEFLPQGRMADPTQWRKR